MNKTKIEKSKGHLTFIVKSGCSIEYFNHDGTVYMASVFNPVMPDGSRRGHFVCFIEYWKTHAVIVGITPPKTSEAAQSVPPAGWDIISAPAAHVRINADHEMIVTPINADNDDDDECPNDDTPDAKPMVQGVAFDEPLTSAIAMKKMTTETLKGLAERVTTELNARELKNRG